METYDKLIPDIKPKEIGFECNICKDEKVVIGEQENSFYFTENHLTKEITYYHECECVIKERTRLKFERDMKRSNLDSIYDEISNTVYETKYEWQKDYKKRVYDFVKNDDTGFIISGQTGSGKSLLLGKALGNLMHLGKECYYMLWKKDMEKLVNQYNKIGEEEQKFFNFITSVEVLYIDDLLKCENNDINNLPNKNINVQMIWEIINKRMYNKDLKTMISTELFESDFNDIEQSLRGRLLQIVGNKENWIQMNKNEDRDIRVRKFNGEF